MYTIMMCVLPSDRPILVTVQPPSFSPQIAIPSLDALYKCMKAHQNDTGGQLIPAASENDEQVSKLLLRKVTTIRKTVTRLVWPVLGSITIF